MKVVVTGGRDFTDKAFVYTTLNHVHAKTPITTLIYGAARGVDTLCAQWARDNAVPELSCPADWEKHKKAAGIIRNKEMIDLKPDLGVVFPGGRGTQHMAECLSKAHIRRYIPPYKTLVEEGTLFQDRYGNMLNEKHDAIINTVNTMGVMGKGVALAIKNRYPEVYELYRECCLRKEVQIGKVLAIRASDGTWVLNIPTKKHWTNPSKYEWVRDGIIDLNHIIRKLELKNIGMPFPGCGNGKLLKYDVRPLLYQYLHNHPNTTITLYQ